MSFPSSISSKDLSAGLTLLLLSITSETRPCPPPAWDTSMYACVLPVSSSRGQGAFVQLYLKLSLVCSRSWETASLPLGIQTLARLESRLHPGTSTANNRPCVRSCVEILGQVPPGSGIGGTRRQVSQMIDSLFRDRVGEHRQG